MGNSSSTVSSSTTTTTTTDGEQYDVFLSFRGEDTRDGFTSHLYKALDEKQIRTFIDNQLVRGEEISAGLLSVIRESKISVVIFSVNYASSKWCLRELAEIMKYREMKKQMVIPVFYKVDPSHVRKQIGSYEAAFAKHELQQVDEVKKWREALTQASSISGWDSSETRPESDFVSKIVRDIWNKLYNISPCDFEDLVEDLVGIEKHIERVVSLLCLEASDSRIIGIWGMGGIGKTTIAGAVFQLVSHRFENRSYFTPSVRAESENNSNGLIRLRDEILSKVLNIENQNSGLPSIPQRIKRMLKQKKVLIVLDDVNKFTEWKILVGGFDDNGLAPGSRIILTARNKQVLRNCGVEDHNMYKVEELNCDEALQLFCNYAFKQNHPTKDFEVLCREVVKIARNVPLAVRVLGGSLLNKSSKRDWEIAVDKFQRIVNPEIFDALRISYDGLDEEEKGLFLDIACFVEFEFKIDEVHFIPNLSSDRGFSLIGLIDKSLVTVERGSFKMHDLLREMGREIVDKESPNKPGDRSRLWRQEDVLHTLKHNDGTGAVHGIFLSTSKLKDVQLGFQTLKKMYNLRTLIIKDDQEHLHISDLFYLPAKLRYLHWNMYALEVLPSSFNPVNLVELDLAYSDIKQLWEGRTHVPNLKWLNLHGCKNLISIPDLSNIPSAEIINLKDCRSLIEIHSSRECPKNLHSLQLKGCESLSIFPSNIHLSREPSFSTSVVLHSSREGSEFSLRFCSSLTKFPHISGTIKSLDLSWSGVEEVPSTIQILSKLESLNMKDCTSLKRISKSICKLKSLVQLDLSGCRELESFPDILEGMELKHLYLRRMAIKELPPSIGHLNQLEELDLSYCISKLEKLPPLSGLCSLKILRLNNHNLTEISEDIGCLSSLEKLELDGNVFERLPKSINKLSKLCYLSLRHCGMLQSLPELPSSLRYLDARNCKQLIHSLPDESKFELRPDGSGSLCFNFMDCLKLNQKAVSNLLIFFRDSLRKMQGMGTEKIISLFKVSHEVTSQLPPYHLRFLQTPDEEVKGSICLPGSEIPEWFRCYINIGSSIVLQNECARSRYIMGFEVCLVFEFEQDYNDDLLLSSLDIHYDCHIKTSDGHKEGFFGNSIQLFGKPVQHSDHILLGYNLSRKCYEFFQELDTRLANHGMSEYVDTSFEFNIRSKDIFGDSSNLGPGFKVKHCGIQPIYVKAQVMNSVSINQDIDDTSGCNDTAEETF